MRKYIELEDAIKKIEEHILPDFRGKVRTILSDLPTVEVMEYPQVEGITPTLVITEASEVSEDATNAFREGQKDMLMFLLEGMKDALEKARMEG